MRAERHAEIVQVAYRLIAERGLEGLRFADVAREAGINNGTLLYYFASKDALIRAVGAFMVDHFSETAAPTNPRAPSDPLAAIRWEFVDAGEHLQDQASVVYTELLARAQRDPSVAALLRDIDAAWHGWLSSLLERGRQTGAIRADLDVSLAATTIMSAIRGVGMQAMIVEDPAAVGPVVTALADLIVAWIAAPAVGVRRGAGPRALVRRTRSYALASHGLISEYETTSRWLSRSPQRRQLTCSAGATCEGSLVLSHGVIDRFSLTRECLVERPLSNCPPQAPRFAGTVRRIRAIGDCFVRPSNSVTPKTC